MKSLNYRPDIDGLRTLAVVPVVLFHANLRGLPGGYVGVDVFFVISGFLITSIINRELSEGQFSILRFYERRARRILPALLAAMLASLAAGWYLLVPEDYENLGRSMLSALLFVSNLWFLQNSGGYFDGNTEFLPLLHTWSLAVEEQFYIFAPILLLLLHRRARRLLIPIMLLIVAGSLAAAIWATPRMPSASFYLLPTRIWELGLGSLLALGALPTQLSRKPREVLALLGLAGVLVPMALYQKDTSFPGLAAVPPVLGATLLIWTGATGSTMVSRFLSTRVMVGVGLISYSLYLWHWPVMAFARNWMVTVHLPLVWKILTTVLSFILGWLSWRFIERPFRRSQEHGGPSQARIFTYSGTSMACVALLAGSLVMTKGFSQARGFTEEQRRLLHSVSDSSLGDSCFGLAGLGRTCLFGAQGAEVRWALWGDSHARSVLAAIDRLAKQAGVGVMYISAPSCAPIPGTHLLVPTKHSPDCIARRDKDFELIKATTSIDTVFLAAYWRAVLGDEDKGVETLVGDSQSFLSATKGNKALVEASLAKVRDDLHVRNMRLILLGNVPIIPWSVGQNVKKQVLFGTPLPIPPEITEVSKDLGQVDSVLTKVARDENTWYVPLADRMCTPVCSVAKTDAAYYRDNNHLTDEGALKLVLPILESRIPAILNDVE